MDMTETISAGATPVVAGATPVQSAPTQGEPTTATVIDDQLGDAGRRALQAERQAARDAAKRAEAAERELEALRTATQSEQEKALAAARKEGAAEAAAKADGRVRRAEVRRALAAAGCVDVDIAAMAGDFGELAVTEDGDVVDLDKTVNGFRSTHPALFAPKRPTGSADAGSPTSAGAPQTTFSRKEIAAMTPAEYESKKAAIMDARKHNRITD